MIPMRPRDFSQQLEVIFQLYRENFSLFLSISALSGALMMLFDFAMALIQTHVFPGMQSRNFHDWHFDRSAAIPSILAAAMLLIAVMFLSILTSSAMTYVASERYWGRAITMNQAIEQVMPRLMNYLWLLIRRSLVAGWPLLVLYIGFALTLAYLFLHRPQHSWIAFFIFFGSFLVLFVPAVVYAIWIGLRYMIAMPIAVVEGLSAKDSMQRSHAISLGSRGRIFGLLFVTGLISSGVGMILGLISPAFAYAIAAATGGNFQSVSHFTHAIAQGLGTTLGAPIVLIATVVAYYDQRTRREGFGYQPALQQPILTTPLAAPPGYWTTNTPPPPPADLPPTEPTEPPPML